MAASRARRSEATLSLDDFLAMLSQAFTSPAPPFDESWRSSRRQLKPEEAGFEAWQVTIQRQIVDLREMAEQGQLENELRYFGIDGWFDFDPCAFIECATEGTFGGWQPGDDTGRFLVPGPVVVRGPDGHLVTCDPADIPSPVVPIAAITWDAFRDWLFHGQRHE